MSELYKDNALSRAKEIDLFLQKCSENDLEQVCKRFLTENLNFQLSVSKPLLGIPFTCKDMFEVKGRFSIPK